MRSSTTCSKRAAPQMATRLQYKEGRAAILRVWLPFIHLGNSTVSIISCLITSDLIYFSILNKAERFVHNLLVLSLIS